MKEWTSNTRGVFTTLGSNNHSEHEYADHSFYSTEPNALRIFLDSYLQQGNRLSPVVWECCCGNGALSEVLKEYGYDVISTDLIDRGYGTGGVDFFLQNETINHDILTNPPYKQGLEAVKHALEIQSKGNKTIMFLKLQFLEGQKRYEELFKDNPPKEIYVHVKRQLCYRNGDTTNKISSAVCYCWFVWEKGFTGNPIIKWI